MDRHGSPGLGPRNDASTRVTKPEGSAAADKLAALKARVAAAISGTGQKRGLNVELHPALADTWKPASKVAESRPPRNNVGKPQHQQPPKQKQLDLSGPSTEELKANPYFDSRISGPQQRQPRQLEFNEKGKYIQIANAQRREAKLQELKARISATTKKVGIDDDSDKAFLVSEPPTVEWWDLPLVTGDTYEHIDDPGTLKLHGPDSIITPYVVHPVTLAAPQDALVPAAKAMYLTAKEQKKIRRQRRAAQLSDLRAKQRLGLVEAPKDKVRIKNMMRVLGQEAVQDPTQIEARVRREVAEREEEHLQTNAERALTKEQKLEKLQRNQENDLARGVHILVYKIGSLRNGQHRWKLTRNAEQLACTGVMLLHPRLNLVIVEAGAHSSKRFQKLCEQRIDWTEAAPSRNAEGKHELKEWLKAEDATGNLLSQHSNTCKLLFAGEEKNSTFKRWSTKIVETDQEAKDWLARVKMDNFWTMAKSVE